MKKRYILLIVVLLLVLTGCDTNYTLTVNDDNIEEEINVVLPENYLPEQTAEEKAAKIEQDDQITPYLIEDQYPILNDTKNKYERHIEKKNGMLNITYNYKYSFLDYDRSHIYSKCFEEKYFNTGRKTTFIAFKKKFYCMTGDKIQFNIKTNEKVTSHNADSVKGNTYTWIIDNNNLNNVDIEIHISNEKGFVMPLKIIIIVTVVVAVFSMLGFGYYKLKNRDSYNEI